MIKSIYSSLSTFKSLTFKSGLNVLISEKSHGATSRQTRNRAGKTSLIEIVHFLTGSKIDKKSLFKAEKLNNVLFGMNFDLGGKIITIERQNSPRAGYILNNQKLSSIDWKNILAQQMFNLNDIVHEIGKPTFRSLFAYFVRRALSGGFFQPEKQAIKQGTGDYQMALMYLMGLDWEISRDWQEIRDQEKNIVELKKASKSGTLGNIIGNAAELRTQLAVAKNRLTKLEKEIASFQIHPQYRNLELEADKLTSKIGVLSNENTMDHAVIRDLEAALESENPPKLTDLKSVYQEAGIVLPDLVNKQYDDVRKFHESIVRNRKDYLNSELEAAKSRIETRNIQKQKLDKRRSEIMGTLKSHGALDQYTRLQSEVGRLKSEVESLQKRFEAAEQLEATKSELTIKRNHLLQRLRRDFSEQGRKLSDAILAYEQISEKLYEDAGSMLVEKTKNGPNFRFEIQGSRSEGIKNMQIFCFDMMLMRLCANQCIGPGFLIHDSHLFDGVDGRQIIRALRIGAETANELGFQYIVTMNEDDAFKEVEEGFNLNDYVLDIRLTDATEDGGLFGFRFD
ncbi:MAG: hypothetical protein OMM_03642 [Candidatus Magnetoglobus multicellularis str. Araruama]|uniref:Uncharacterized protein n=1 Tax=Candidatus Magnetoglobus multicellularis str. Araruama TaxID=890399 RepID=A0A1V1P544_9BACT|nr:MAG: hypothetical protein OMM_03642 [Candidatus Magnetoglobus multicellularis str. Araruama]